MGGDVMDAEQIVETVHAAGGKLALIEGGLRGKNLTDSTRQLVKRHKTEIIHLLLDETPAEPLLKPCSICGGLDFVHGHDGGFFCITCQPNARPGVSVRAGSTRQEPETITFEKPPYA